MANYEEMAGMIGRDPRQDSALILTQLASLAEKVQDLATSQKAAALEMEKRIESKLEAIGADLKDMKSDNKELTEARVKMETRFEAMRDEVISHKSHIDTLYSKSRESLELARDVNRKISIGALVTGAIVSAVWAVFTFVAGRK